MTAFAEGPLEIEDQYTVCGKLIYYPGCTKLCHLAPTSAQRCHIATPGIVIINTASFLYADQYFMVNYTYRLDVVTHTFASLV